MDAKTEKRQTQENSHRRGRRLAAWKNRHDNGWSTHVIENLDGTFSAWAAPDAGWVVVDYVEDGPEMRNGPQSTLWRARAAMRSARRCAPGGWPISMRCSEVGRFFGHRDLTHISPQHTLTQDFRACVGGNAHMDGFGGYDGIAAIDEKAALAGQPARVDLAAPVAFLP